MASGKRFVKNTVKGTRRGSKWPPETKTACMVEMLVRDNLHEVAQRHGVPESTLRTWYKEAQRKTEEEKSGLWGQAMADIVKGIAYDATAGARLTADMINRRLHIGAANAQRNEEIRQLIITGLSGGEIGPEEVTKLEKEMQYRREVGDYAMANYMRALMAVSSKAREVQGENTPPAITVILEGGAADLAK